MRKIRILTYPQLTQLLEFADRLIKIVITTSFPMSKWLQERNVIHRIDKLEKNSDDYLIKCRKGI